MPYPLPDDGPDPELSPLAKLLTIIALTRFAWAIVLALYTIARRYLTGA